ncbi:hypothetical protein EDB19DRAFT_1908712 [Suillus lakei]|nr:hypothetical protein EDB19DRAFT_1908712 [Suillus lakei]
MADEHSFDFLDPTEVLRGCHIIPSFTSKQRCPDGSGLSACAGDKDDWCAYYVNQFMDRDMMMRFHFGLGVGHTYSHCRTSQAKSPDKYIAGFLDDVDAGDDGDVGSHYEDEEEDDAEDDEEDDAEDDEEDDTEDEWDEGSEDAEQQSGSSRESLLSQFDDMYDSELELDYEN